MEGKVQKKLVTATSLADALARAEVQNKFTRACPPLLRVAADGNPAKWTHAIWSACPKHQDPAGLGRLELIEALAALQRNFSMNQFVVISAALNNITKHFDHELRHLDKHQRKMNR